MKTQFILLITLVMLAGCSYQPTVQPQSRSWSEHQQQLMAYDQWQLQGKLGFKTLDSGGSATLYWSQNQQQYQVQLKGPLGAGNVVIEGDQTSAQMLRGDTVYRATPTALAARFTGLPIPVDALAWWVRGLPNPNNSASTGLVTNPDGTAANFVQQGWSLTFSRYHMTNAGLLPKKISGQLGDQSFKLVISRWNS
ncbi:MAG: lipoprotein insertase outer membrane protein LolB, partial [Porticoccaceae bacterium]